MSDFDKNKVFQNKKKYFAYQKDGASFSSRSFTKSSHKHDRELKDSDKYGESKEKPIQQPTILIKAREPNPERSASPKRNVKENDPPNAPSTAEPNIAPTVQFMKKPTKLLDDGCFMSDHIQEYLQDQSDFLVVGIVGGQGVGKSSILNLLLHSNLNKNITSTIFSSMIHSKESSSEQTDSHKVFSENTSNTKDFEDTQSEPKPSIKHVIFKPQHLYKIETANYGTRGIDAFITSNRIIYLDCQPIVSCAVLDNLVDIESKRAVPGEYLPVENSAEIYGLQLTSFFLSVCHIVIVVQDWFIDTNVVRFLQTAEMLKPSLPAVEDDYMDYFPHILFLHNKCLLQDFSISNFKVAQNAYKEMFSKSKLKIETNMGLGNGTIVPNLNPTTCGDPINLFLLPEYEEDNEKFKGYPSIERLIEVLRMQIHGTTKHPLTHVQLTEKTWVQFAAKVWDNVKKSSFFLEYSKLLP